MRPLSALRLTLVTATVSFAAQAAYATNLPCDQARYDKGMKMLAQVSAESGEAVIRSLAEYAPFLACMTVEFPYGDVFSRPQLTLKQRELITVAGLVAMGTARPQLKVHLNAAFNVGLTREEILESIIHMAVYSGFPSAINGVFAMKEVEAERAARATGTK
jgi:4-carboxymuconolactone decarboxylase